MKKLKIQSTAYPYGDKLSFDEWRSYITLGRKLDKVIDTLKKIRLELDNRSKNTEQPPKLTKDDFCPPGKSGIVTAYFFDGERIYPANNSINEELKEPLIILTNDDLKLWLESYTESENYEMCAKIRDELNRRKIQP